MAKTPHPDHDRGLEFDLGTLPTRRRTLGPALGIGATAASTAAPSTATSSAISSATATSAAATSAGTSGLTRAIAECTANGTQTRKRQPDRTRRRLQRPRCADRLRGGPAKHGLQFRHVNNGSMPLAGVAFYQWHATKDGQYSLYGRGLENENFLRTSQIDMTEASCNEVYSSAGYGSSLANFPNTPLGGDMVFSDDGGSHQLASTSGSLAAGYQAALKVAV